METAAPLRFVVHDVVREKFKPSSRFSHYAGDVGDLPEVVAANWGKRRPGKFTGSFFVPIPPVVMGKQFFTRVRPDLFQAGIAKPPAKVVDIIVFTPGLIQQEGESVPEGCDGFIVAIHGYGKVM